MNKYKFIILLFLSLGLISCQKIEKLDNIVFDYNQFSKITISAEKKYFSNLYETKFYDPYIGHSLKNPPIYYLNELLNKNINIFGTQNKLEINIIDASVKKTEILNNDNTKYKEKNIFLFEVNFLVEYILLDDLNLVLASTIIEANRSTTSSRYISLNETSKIIDNLIYDCLIDFSFKTKELTEIHMNNFLL